MAHAVYVHVPFCSGRCGYCNFYSGEPLELVGNFSEWVVREAELRAEAAAGPLSSVYLGGGTPTLLGADGVGRILESIRRLWGLEKAAEVTVEVNPTSGGNLRELQLVGVNRLSVGVQALDDRLLGWLGRRHDTRMALETLTRATAAGFDSVSADLLYGVPGMQPEELADWLGMLAERGASHISAYSLELHPGTEVERRIALGESRRCEPGVEQAQWEALTAAAEDHGYHAYEVSNFARPGAESRHNQVYWERAPYLGLGPGAHSFAPGHGPWGRRSWNDSELRAYGAAVRRGALPPGAAEDLTLSEALLEALFLALRRVAPVCTEALAEAFGLNRERVEAVFATLGEKELLHRRRPGFWAPTREGLRRADGMALWAHERLLQAKTWSP